MQYKYLLIAAILIIFFGTVNVVAITANLDICNFELDCESLQCPKSSVNSNEEFLTYINVTNISNANCSATINYSGILTGSITKNFNANETKRITIPLFLSTSIGGDYIHKITLNYVSPIGENIHKECECIITAKYKAEKSEECITKYCNSVTSICVYTDVTDGTECGTNKECKKGICTIKEKQLTESTEDTYLFLIFVISILVIMILVVVVCHYYDTKNKK